MSTVNTKSSLSSVTIMGAGLVGSLWAVLLRQKGYPVQMFEKRPDMRGEKWLGDRSINLIITSRGIHGLKQAGLFDQARKLSVPVYGRMIHGRSGECTYQPYGQKNEYNLSISRSALNRFLLTAAEEAGTQIYFEHELSAIDFNKKTLAFNNASQFNYEHLFATDGAGSPVRKGLLNLDPSIYQEQIDWLEADYLEMTLPLGLNGESQLRTDALHIWPRGSHMLMALANLDGSFTVTLYMPRTGDVSFSSMQTAEQVKRFFQDEFPDAISLMPDYVTEYLNHPRGRLGTVRTSRWNYKDSVALMGDAAHAIVPFFGQGMNCGFEDCTTFLKILETENTAGDLKITADVLSKYSSTQKPNADAIADMAVENWYEMSTKVGNEKFLLRKSVEHLLEKKFPDKFKSRYGLVTYTLVPYKEAQDIGRRQDLILSELCANIQSPEEVNWAKAEELLA